MHLKGCDARSPLYNVCMTHTPLPLCGRVNVFNLETQASIVSKSTMQQLPWLFGVHG